MTTKVEIGSFPTEFKVAVRHASAVRKVTQNVICVVTDRDGNVGLGEGCPRSYVTGETSESALAFLNENAKAVADVMVARGFEGVQEWTAANRNQIDQNPAAFCAIELAVLDLLGKKSCHSIEQVVGLAPITGSFPYTAVLGDNPKFVYSLLLQRYLFRGFRDYKLKLSGDLERDRFKVKRLARRKAKVRVRVDANNLWTNSAEAIDHLKALEIDLFGIEEPLKADDLAGFQEIAAATQTPIIVDESGLRAEQILALPGQANQWIVNCRVSKMGGIQRSLEVVDAARSRGIGIVVGAQVGETSILTRAGLTVASAAGDLLVGQEGGFGTYLLKSDFTDPIVMFNKRGEIVVGEDVIAGAAGLGLRQKAKLTFTT